MKQNTAARLFAEYADFDALVIECCQAGLGISMDETPSPDEAVFAVIQAVLPKGWAIEFNYGCVVVYYRYAGNEANTSKKWGDYGYICHNREPTAIACAALAGWLATQHLPTILDDKGVVKKALERNAKRRALRHRKKTDPRAYELLQPRPRRVVSEGSKAPDLA